MAISIAWGSTFIIFIPRADMPIVQVSPEIRELNVDAFRLELKALEASADGEPWPDTHRHVTQTVLSGATYARLVEILPPYFVEFEDGQYSVRASGANHNILDVKINNQVSLGVQNSAGLVNSPELEYASFANAVTIDVVAGVAGTTFPTGSKRRPVNNLVDALSIAASRGITRLDVLGNLSITSGTYAGLTFYGESRIKTTIAIAAAASVVGGHFHNANITGVLDGGSLLQDCTVKNLAYVDGFIERCLLIPGGIITASGETEARFLNCSSGLGLATGAIVPEVTPAELDLSAWWRADVGTEASWTAQVGSTHLAQSNASFRPALRSDGPNDRPYFRFNAAAPSFFESPVVQATAAFTIFLLVRAPSLPATLPAWEHTGYLVSHGATGGAASDSGYGALIIDGSRSVQAGEAYVEDADATSAWELWVIKSDGATTTRLSVNGVSLLEADIVSTGANGVLSVGAGLGGAFPVSVDIAEVGIAPFEFTEGDETALLSYVADHYGLVVSDKPTIDMGGSGSSLVMRNYSGDVIIRNKTGEEKVSIDLVGGHITVDSTVITGPIEVRGNGLVTNNSLVAVDTSGLINPAANATATAATLASAHGAGSWTTATGFATPGAAMTLTSGERDAIQAKVLSDATPFPGARIDAAVSSRAAPGAAMALTGPTQDTLVDAVFDEPVAGHLGAGSVGQRLSLLDTAISSRLSSGSYTAPDNTSVDLLRKALTNRLEAAPGNPGTLILFDDDGVTPLLTWATRDESGGAVAAAPGAPSRRGAGT